MDMVRRLLIEQRKRLIASVLGHAEREFYPKLTPKERDDFRTHVLDSIDRYHDLVLDVLKVTKDDAIRNDEAVDLIRQVHEGQRQLVRSLNER